MYRLLDAYEEQDSVVKDRELLLSALKCGKNQRCLPSNLTSDIGIQFNHDSDFSDFQARIRPGCHGNM